MMVQSHYAEFPIGTKKIQPLGFLRLNREKGEACPAIFWDWLCDTQNNRSLSDSSGFDAGLAACGSMVFDRAMVGSLFCTGQCRSNSLAEMLGRLRFRPTAAKGTEAFILKYRVGPFTVRAAQRSTLCSIISPSEWACTRRNDDKLRPSN